MKRFRNIIAISAFSMLVLALPSIASAQWGGNNGGYGYPNGNNRGGYGGNLENVADRLKDSSRDFERQVDREFNGNNRNRNYGGGGILGTILNGGNNRGYGNNSNIQRLAEDFRRAADDFENRVGGNGRDMYRGQEAANRMLSIGSQIDRAIGNSGGYGGNGRNSGLQYQWGAIRRDLNIVANAYGNQNRGRGGRNNRLPF